MISRSQQLAAKRQALQLRCALQRQQVAFQTATIEAGLGPLDRLIGTVTGVAKNPVAIVAAVAGFVMLKPWRLLKFAGQGWLWFSLAKKVFGWLETREGKK